MTGHVSAIDPPPRIAPPDPYVSLDEGVRQLYADLERVTDWVYRTALTIERLRDEREHGADR